MSLQVEKLEHNMAKLTIEVAAEEVEKALQAAYLKQRGKINIPGFRKGKVPRQMIEKMYGAEIFYDEAANKMISEAYGKAYDECELDIVSQPSIDIVQLEKGKDFIFTAEVATKPEVKLGEYKGLKVDKYSTRVTQKEVDEEIDKEISRRLLPAENRIRVMMGLDPKEEKKESDTSGEELSGNEIPNVEEEAEETQETEETDDSISFEIPAEDETVSDPEQDNSEDDGPEDIEDTSEDEEPEAETDVEGSVENEEEIQE